MGASKQKGIDAGRTQRQKTGVKEGDTHGYMLKYKPRDVHREDCYSDDQGG